MAKQIINVGVTANDKKGDSLRVAFTKVNSNFTELYTAMNADVQIPTQSGNGGKYLTTDGANLSWGTISSTTNHLVNGNYSLTLGSDGTVNLPQAPSAGAAVLQPNNTTFGIKVVSNGNIWAFGIDGSVTGPTGLLTTHDSYGEIISAVNGTIGSLQIKAKTIYTTAQDPDGSSYAQTVLSTTGTASINVSDGTNTRTWNFSNGGNLLFPNNLGVPNVNGTTDSIRLYDFNSEGTQYNYSIGAEGSHIWFNVDQAGHDDMGFKFYGAGTLAAKITTAGNLYISGIKFPDSSTQTTAWTGVLPSPTYSGSSSIGNVTPAALNLNNTGSPGQVKTQLTLINTAGNANTGSAIDFFTYTGAGNGVPGARIQSVDDGNFSSNFSIALKDTGNNGNGSLSTQWTFGSDGKLKLPGTLWAQASDNGSIVFSDDGSTDHGSLKVDGGHNMLLSAESNFYIKRAGQDRLAITDTTTTLMAGTDLILKSNKNATENVWTFGSNGVLTVPVSQYGTGQIFAPSSTTLFLGTSSHYIQVRGSDGALVFPDTSVQTTAYLGTATTSQIGGVQPDGTSITISNGVISSASAFQPNGVFNITTTGGTTVLTSATAQNLTLTGSNTQTIQLPDATTLKAGWIFRINNNSSSASSLTVNNAGGGQVGTVPQGGDTQFILLDNSTANGSWDNHGWIPGNLLMSSSVFQLGSSAYTIAPYNSSLTIGTSTGGTTYNFGTGATLSGNTKTINIGTGGVSGSTTTITVGSASGTSTTAFNGVTTFNAAVKFNGTTTLGIVSTAQTAGNIVSAATIAPTNPITFVSGNTQINTITPPSGIATYGGQITLIPTGTWTTATGGNIALATTTVTNKALIMTYDAGTSKWYPSY